MAALDAEAYLRDPPIDPEAHWTPDPDKVSPRPSRPPRSPSSAASRAIRVERVPPAALVIGAVSSVQFGAALAKSIFDEVGSGGTVFLRVLFAALVLALIWRPRIRAEPARARLVFLFGISLAGMNLASTRRSTGSRWAWR